MKNVKHSLTISDETVFEYRDGDFSLIHNGIKLTRSPGFNCAIKTLGMWTNTTCGTWEIVEATGTHLYVRVVFETVPLTQIWKFDVVDGGLVWSIDLEVEEWICIDKFRFLCVMNPLYAAWRADESLGAFPRFTPTYNSILVGGITAEYVALDAYQGNTYLPSVVMRNRSGDFLPFIQNFPARTRAHAIGFWHEVIETHHDFDPNVYPLLEMSVSVGTTIPSSVSQRLENKRDVSPQEGAVAEQKRKTRVALVNLPWQRGEKWGIRAGSRWPHVLDSSEGDYLPFPFFLSYATSLLRQHDIDAILIDAIAEQITEEAFMEKLASLDIDYLVAETSIPSFDYDRALLHRISQLNIPIILCGPVSHMCYEKFLKDHQFLSYILCGEYECTLLELIRALQEKTNLQDVAGLVYRDGHMFRKTASRSLCDVDALPWPHRDGVPMEKYLDAPGEMLTPSVQILASRGCPFPCQFCLWPQVMYQGRTYRARSVKSVIDEMEHLVKDKGFRSVYFDDDTFNIGKDRMLAFCREIRSRGLDKTQWAIMARADLMDKEILNEMKQSGLWAVKYGVESADQALVDNIGKSMDLSETEAMIRYTQELGIRTHLTFTFGLPGETQETIDKTIQWALDLNPFSIQFSIMTPFPGTQYYDYLKSKDQIVSDDLSTYDGHFKSVIKSEALSPEDLEAAKEKACRLWDEHVKKRSVQNGAVEKSDILLIQCPPWDNAMPPLGIAYLAHSLRLQGAKVTVCDLNAQLSHDAVDAQHLWEQKNYDLWHNNERFKETFSLIEDVTNRCMQEVFDRCEPMCVGLSVNAAGISFAVKLIEIIKKIRPDSRIVIGGWGCVNEHMRSLYPWDQVDAFVIGEGEETIKCVIDAFKAGDLAQPIPGAVLTSLGEDAFERRKPIPNIDVIPWPTYREFDLSLYTSPVLPIFGSRGCIGCCSFCNDWPFSRPYRYRTAHHVFDEIRHHVEKYDAHVFSFKDLLCNGNIQQLKMLCNLIISSGLEIHWDSQAIARKEMTAELLCKMKQAGCGTLIYGIESFSNVVLKKMKKIFTREECEQVIRDTYKAGIGVFFNIIVGYPGETEEEFQETLDALKRNREYITQIGAVSTCLVNGGSDLDMNREAYGIELSDDPQIRAKKWWSSDGTNTYEVRQERATRVLELMNELGLSYATVTM